MKFLPKKRDESASRAPARPDGRDLFERLFDTDPWSLVHARFPELLGSERARGEFPPMNLAEDESGYELTFELPGVGEDEIHVELVGSTLTVFAERTSKTEDEQKDYHRVETYFGSMRRSVTLPDDARRDPDAIEARTENGVLHVKVPKVEPTPTRRIEVKRG